MDRHGWRQDTGVVRSGPGHEGRLARLTVVVDGAGPGVDAVASALRAIGVGRLSTGRYAAEPALWAGPAVRVDAEQAVAAVVFVRSEPLDSVVAAPWWHTGVTHLPVVLAGESAEIGPLVIPGVSSCTRCHELLRRGRGPTWPPGTPASPGVPGVPGVPGADAVPGRPGPRALPDRGTVVLAAALVAVTLRSALHGVRDLAGVSSEVRGDRPEVLHRHWARQPDCPCAAPATEGLALGAAALTVEEWTMGA